MKSIWSSIKVKFLNIWERIKVELNHIVVIVKNLKQEMPIPENYDVRLFFFVVGYLFLSLLGMYNFAHLLAFVYIIWLIERNILGR